MEAKELRVGNIVEWEGNHLIEDVEDLHDACMFNPIPLTEDWLIKFGFDKTQVIHKDKSVTPITYKVDKRIRLQWYSEKSLEEINTGELMFILNERLIKSVQYVHQLQNLFFALTGKELQITETAQ